MERNPDFFNEQSANSSIKTQIILDVFKLWLNDNKRKRNLSYIDLFSGPGIYEDGTISTPISILQEICETKNLAQKFNVIFNDYNINYIAKLRRTILNIRNAKFLKVLTTSVSDIKNINITNSKTPSFIFLDPYGWKGINKNHINSALKNEKCEIAVLFNFNQFNRFISIDGLFDNLFDKKSLEEIRDFFIKNSEQKKGKFVLDKFIDIITTNCKYCHSLSLEFNMENTARISHYIVLIIRDKNRFEIIKQNLKEYGYKI